MATFKNTIINDSGFISLPKGTTNQRPATPQPGMIRFNTSENSIEYYNGSEWLLVNGPLGSETNPASGPAAILEENPNATNGAYWINIPNVGPELIYCNMEYNDPKHGRGWMLAGKVQGNSTYFETLSSNWSDVTTTGDPTIINDGANMKNNAWNFVKHRVLSMSYQDGNPGSRNWWNFTHRLNCTMNDIFSWDNRQFGFIKYEEFESTITSNGRPSNFLSSIDGGQNYEGQMSTSSYGAVALNVALLDRQTNGRPSVRNFQEISSSQDAQGGRIGFVGDNTSTTSNDVWPGQQGGPDDQALGIGCAACGDNGGCRRMGIGNAATFVDWSGLENSQPSFNGMPYLPVNPHLWIK